MKRREFITTAGLSAALIAIMQNPVLAGLLDDPAYKFQLLRNDVGIFTSRGGTIGWMINKEGIVVVDSQFPDSVAQLVKELKNKSALPVKYLINTHHHGDHTSGNIAFKGFAERVVAHSNSLANQHRVAATQKTEEKQLYPDLTFTDKWKISLGAEKLRALHYGAAHTNGDSVIHFQNANIAHMGDLVFNRRYPVIDRSSGASIRNWIEVLEKCMKEFNNDTLFVFGHSLNPEKVTGNKEDLKAMQNYLSRLLDFVSSQIKAGKSATEIYASTAIPGAEDFSGQGIQRSLTAAYEELTM